MFQPVKNQRLADVVFDQILELIISKKIMPGERLPSERVMAEQMVCSRSAIREAIKMLETMGLVEIRKGVNGGTYVKESNFENVAKSIYLMYRLAQVDIFQLLEYRKVIELAAVRYATERASPEKIDMLKENVNQLKENLHDPEFRKRNNRDFHLMIASFSQNKILMMSMQAIIKAIDHSLEVLVQDEEASHILWKSHDNIVKAMEKRDGDLAERKMEEHLLSIERRVRKGKTSIKNN